MEADPDGCRITGLCRLVGLSRQGFYKAQRERQRTVLETAMIVELVQAERRLQPRLGGRKLLVRLGADLGRMGIAVGRDRFFALLRAEGLLVARSRGKPRTTDSRHGMKAHANRLRHIEPSMAHQVWVSDLTYLRTAEGFLYLSLITDAWSRKIVGYEVSDRLEAEGCLRALRMALRQLPAGARPIHHSDRGIQYCCASYVAQLRKSGLEISMTEANHCYENALAERVNGILKQEYALNETFPSNAHAVQTTIQAIRLYNECRPHMGLAYATPAHVHEEAA